MSLQSFALNDFFAPSPTPIAPEPQRHRVPRGGSEEIPPELLRFGVQFCDGSKDANTGGCHISVAGSELDAQPILDAAARAQVSFSDEHLPERPDEGDGSR